MTRAQSLWTAFLVLFATPGPSAAQPFPTSFERDRLLDWVVGETRIQPGDVVSVGATDIVAIRSKAPIDAPAAPGRWRLEIHAEVVSARLAEADGTLSWRGLMRVDCLRQAVQVLSIRSYAERNLQGEAREAEVDDEWIAPGLGSQLHTVVRAACDTGFRRPFGGLAAAATGEAQDAAAVAAEPGPSAPGVAQPAARAGASTAVVQISAALSARLAEQEIERIRVRFADGRDLEPRVERAVVGGRTVYRARLGGFESREDAHDFCRTLKAAAQDCFVRDGRG